MPIAKITPTAEEVGIEAGKSALVRFSVSNASGRKLHLGFQVKSEDGSDGWLGLEGAAEREVEDGGSTMVEVKASPPKELVGAGQAARTFAFRLRAYDAKNTEDCADSSAVGVRATAPPVEKKGAPWAWLALAALLLALAGGGAAFWLMRSEKMADSFLGKPCDEVVSAHGKKYSFVVEERPARGDEAPGSVVGQDPEKGESLGNRSEDGLWTVTLTKAEGLADDAMPDVLSLSYEEARKKLESSGQVDVARVDAYSDRTPGTVVQSLVGSGADGRKTVQLTVAAPVPNLSGRPANEAEKALEALGLKALRRPDRFVESMQAGIVVDQEPKADGRPAEENGRPSVWLTVSAEGVEVPNVQQLSSKRAEEILKSVGLRMQEKAIQEGSAPVDTVVNQKPAYGSKVARDSVVEVVVRRVSAIARPLTVIPPPVIQTPGRPLVRDHRQPSGSPIVRDHAPSRGPR